MMASACCFRTGRNGRLSDNPWFLPQDPLHPGPQLTVVSGSMTPAVNSACVSWVLGVLVAITLLL